MPEEEIEIVEGEPCPVCHNKTLTLMERVVDVPYFGITHLFSMECSSCDYGMADLESEDERDPVRTTFEVSSEEDLKVRVVKSANATVKVPRMVEITPGPDSSGYITNIEGLLNRVKKIIEELTEDEDTTAAKKAKAHLKKLQRVFWGRESLKVVIEDPTGNSAIISDKAEVAKLKK